MMNVKSILKCFTLLILNSSCAFSMGSRRGECSPPVLPTRPVVMNCVANADGTGFCNGERVLIVNFVCREPGPHKAEQIWIKDVLRAVDP